MAGIIHWPNGEGYDIHVLRGGAPGKKGPPSKRLDQILGPIIVGTTLTFDPHFKGAPKAQGVEVDLTTGVVTAEGHPSSPQPKFPNFNFLMTARQVLGGVGTDETIIRVHVHDSIKKIWLTPSALTIHEAADECRFTVLAQFDDDTVGDITDWPQLAYKSSKPTVVKVFNRGDLDESGKPEPAGGRLKTLAAGMRADITVTLNLTAPPTNKTSPVRSVHTEKDWSEVGKDAEIEFVPGKIVPNKNAPNKVVPNKDDPFGAARNSVKSVVENATNILFVSEGFTKRTDFNDAVAKIVEQLQTTASLEPFQLLANSINYWSVFVESKEDGIGILGEQKLLGTAPNQLASRVPLPRPPGAPAAQWTVENMIHEAGLPVPSQTPPPDVAAWLANRAPLYDNLPSAAQVDAAALKDWNDLKQHTLLNERDTAFGLALSDRPRASGQGLGETRLFLDARRTNRASLGIFLNALRHGKDPNLPSNPGYDIGGTWLDRGGGTVGKDLGLVCFVCQSGVRGLATAQEYFMASTGISDSTSVTAGTDGTDITFPMGQIFSPPIVASVVAHGCGHAFGLGDEYGDIEKSVAPGTVPAISVRGANLVEAIRVVTTNPGPPPPNLVDPTGIIWQWPRITTAAVLGVVPVITGGVQSLKPEKCDQNGIPDPNGKFLLVQLRKGPPTPFIPGKAVRIRTWPVLDSNAPDPISAVPLFVEKSLSDRVLLSYKDPNVPQMVDSLFKADKQYSLIFPLVVAGAEKLLVAKSILNQIISSASPLNAPDGSQSAACVPAATPTVAVAASNLPLGFKPPPGLPTNADIIGIYDGGGNFDCGVFRPAGRCKMRSGFDDTIPFCHVCRYVIVERVDPTLHGVLDAIYDPQYPK